MKKNIDKKIYRNFGFTMALFISLIFGIIIPLLFHHPISMVPFYIAGVFFLTSCIFPKILGIIYHPWMILSNFLHGLNTYILLFIIFYLVFTPWAIILKMLGKDFMEKRLDTTPNSYWKTSEPQQTQNMENIY